MVFNRQATPNPIQVKQNIESRVIAIRPGKLLPRVKPDMGAVIINANQRTTEASRVTAEVLAMMAERNPWGASTICR